MAAFSTHIATPPHRFASMDAADHARILPLSNPTTPRRHTRASFAAELSSCLVDFVVQLLPTPEEMAVKEDVRKLLERLIRNIEPDSRLLSFGSTANGFSLKNSDMDLCCLIDSDQPPLSASDMVTMLGDLLVRETKFHVKPLPHARIPIIKLSLSASQGLPFGISCDIGFENRLALENTRLLFSYASIDPTRVRTMVLFLKVWSKRRKINSPYRGTLSSYGYVLLVLYFLIHVKNPPVLPNLQTMPPLREMRYEDTHLKGCNIWFFDDIDLLRQRWQSMNLESVAELLMDFFKFYAREFTYNLGVASIRAGLLTKDSKGWQSDHDAVDARDRNRLCIEDPFETTYNVARTVTKEGLFLIRGEFMRASRLLAARPERAIVALAQLCEERDESIPLTPTGAATLTPSFIAGTHFYSSASHSPAQTPYIPSSPSFSTSSCAVSIKSAGSDSGAKASSSSGVPVTPVVDRMLPNACAIVAPPDLGRSPTSQAGRSPSSHAAEPALHAKQSGQDLLGQNGAQNTLEHMAPTRAKWTAPPPSSAPLGEQQAFEEGIGLGLSLATTDGMARQQQMGIGERTSWSGSSCDELVASSTTTDEDSSLRSVDGSPGASENSRTLDELKNGDGLDTPIAEFQPSPRSATLAPPPVETPTPTSDFLKSSTPLKPPKEIISFPGKPGKSYAPPAPPSPSTSSAPLPVVQQYGRLRPSLAIPDAFGTTTETSLSPGAGASPGVRRMSRAGGGIGAGSAPVTPMMPFTPLSPSTSTAVPRGAQQQQQQQQPQQYYSSGPHEMNGRAGNTYQRPPQQRRQSSYTGQPNTPPRFSASIDATNQSQGHHRSTPSQSQSPIHHTPPRFNMGLGGVGGMDMSPQWYYPPHLLAAAAAAAAYGQDLQLLQRQLQNQHLSGGGSGFYGQGQAQGQAQGQFGGRVMQNQSQSQSQSPNANASAAASGGNVNLNPSPNGGGANGGGAKRMRSWDSQPRKGGRGGGRNNGGAKNGRANESGGSASASPSSADVSPSLSSYSPSPMGRPLDLPGNGNSPSGYQQRQLHPHQQPQTKSTSRRSSKASVPSSPRTNVKSAPSPSVPTSTSSHKPAPAPTTKSPLHPPPINDLEPVPPVTVNLPMKPPAAHIPLLAPSPSTSLPPSRRVSSSLLPAPAASLLQMKADKAIGEAVDPQ